MCGSSREESIFDRNLRKRSAVSFLSDTTTASSDISRRTSRRSIGKLRDAGELNRNWSVARDIFICRVQSQNPFPRPDVLQSIALNVFREAYEVMGDTFDISDISVDLIRSV